MKHIELHILFKNGLASLYPIEEIENLFFMTLDKQGINKIDFRANGDVEFSKEQEQSVLGIYKGLGIGKPIQYLLGEAYFYEDYYLENEKVLIPRGETEELVQWMINTVPEKSNILDIGTGSGCIPIALKKNLPLATVCSIDVSPEALEMGKANEERILGKKDIAFKHCDILKEFPDFKPTVIVSNPPYVTQEDKMKMHENVLENEPHLALFSKTPMQFYECITLLAQEHLPTGGNLFFEINEKYGREVMDYMKSNGFTKVELRKDLNGKDRMVKGVKS